ncbi:MAG: 50S ribosomal protein L11 methyltransferase [Lachnospiraceae bacterium]|nr:50S ribosomal protein L11 methyltransferase [Lachnospiraceae bacterium]
MQWRKITIETTTQAEEIVESVLCDFGITGTEIEDNLPFTKEELEKMYVDVPEVGEDDGTAKVSCYIDMETDADKLIDELSKKLAEYAGAVDLGSLKFTKSVTEDKDWMNSWKQNFKPIRVADDIVIKPTWEAGLELKNTDTIIEIDPGSAFGTGTHETTKLCVTAIKKYLKKDDAVIDVGTGSGILSILAMKLGAKCAVGTDIDANAVSTAKTNTVLNKITKNVVYLEGDVIGDEKIRKEVGYQMYDVVVANILADVVIPLTDVLKDMIKPGGTFITSGIIKERAGDVEAALAKNNLKVVDKLELGDWVCFVAKA